MPVTLAGLNARRAVVKIKVDGETLTVTYNRSVITPNLQSRLRESRDEEGGSLVRFTRDAVVEWDLLGEDGKPLPLDENTLGSVPSDILLLIETAIYEDLSPNSETPAPT